MTKARDLANASTALSAVSATELGYVDGVTSAIQTQMDAKAPSSTAVTLTGTQTLTNKTLTSPALTTPTISTATTNGDILYGTGSGALTRLGIGTTGQVLNVSGGVPAWATASGGSLTISQLATGTLSGTSTTLASSLSSYNFLMVVITGYKSASNENFWMTINNNTTDNYSYVYNVQSGSIVSQSSYESSTSGFPVTFYDQTAANNVTNQVIFTLENCKNAGFTTMTKHSRYVIAGPTNTTEAGQGLFRSAAAVSSLEIKTGGTSATGGTYYVFGG